MLREKKRSQFCLQSEFFSVVFGRFLKALQTISDTYISQSQPGKAASPGWHVGKYLMLKTAADRTSCWQHTSLTIISRRNPAQTNTVLSLLKEHSRKNLCSAHSSSCDARDLYSRTGHKARVKPSLDNSDHYPEFVM